MCLQNPQTAPSTVVADPGSPAARAVDNPPVADILAGQAADSQPAEDKRREEVDTLPAEAEDSLPDTLPVEAEDSLLDRLPAAAEGEHRSDMVALAAELCTRLQEEEEPNDVHVEKKTKELLI